MLIIHDSTRLESWSKQDLARALKRTPSLALKPVLAYIHSDGWYVVSTNYNSPSKDWIPLSDPVDGKHAAWLLPVDGEGL